MAGGALSVGVVGCGTAGPAAALFLARAGHRVSILERAPALGPVGAGFLLQPTGLEVLDRLGVLDAVLEHGAVVRRLRSVAHGGRVLLDLEYPMLRSDLHGLGLHRATLLAILTRALDDAGIPTRCGTEVEALEPGDDGRVSLRCLGGRREGPFDLVIVADGSRSSLRHAAGRPRRESVYPWGALWAIAPDPERRFDGELFQVVRGTGVMMGFLPTGARPDDPTPLVSLFWSLRGDRLDAWRDAGLDSWKRTVLELEPRADALLDRIRSAEDLTFASYLDVVLRPAHRGRVVVLGDAAHAMSPQLGQGVNLALVDAMTLARCIGTEPDLAAALRRYERERRAHLAFYQRATRWLTPLFQSGSRTLGLVRDATFPIAGALPPLRNQMIRSMAGLKRGVLRRSLPAWKRGPGGSP